MNDSQRRVSGILCESDCVESGWSTERSELVAIPNDGRPVYRRPNIMVRPDFDLLHLPPNQPSSDTPAMVSYDREFTDISSDSALLPIALIAADSATELSIKIVESMWAPASTSPRIPCCRNLDDMPWSSNQSGDRG